MLPRRAPLEGGTPDTQYLFLSHHKTGTALGDEIANDMSMELNITKTGVLWFSVLEASNFLSGIPTPPTVGTADERSGAIDLLRTTGCTGQIIFYQDMRAPLLKHILKSCPGTRAVHFVRRPSEIVVSNYAYTYGLQPGGERQSDVDHGERLRQLSLAEGVDEMCHTYLDVYNDQMIELHQMIQDNNLDNIVEVRLEDFETNYDNTTRSIFETLLGSDHPSIDKLVKKVRAHDINRWNQTVVDNNPHISSESDEATAKMEMTRMLEDGNSCIKKLPELDTLMGYTEPYFVSPE